MLEGLPPARQPAAVPVAAASPQPQTVLRKVNQSDILGFCGEFAPFDVEGYSKVRLGGANDGGYIFIDDFAEVTSIISCGISNDVSCDLDFANLGKEVLQFDHTVPAPPINHPNFRFHKQAIDPDREIPGSIPLSEVVRQHNAKAPGTHNLLLKIDIEGSEWSTFAKFPANELRQFRQIACEFHWSSKLADPAYFSLCQSAIETIRQGFFPVHLHANNFVGFATVAGVSMPDVFEVTFVNNDLYRRGQRQQASPAEIDAPNNIDMPDLYLGSPFLIGSK
ncbi:hypothetical protein [Tardiphaga sp. 866_E4_N2_3]